MNKSDRNHCWHMTEAVCVIDTSLVIQFGLLHFSTRECNIKLLANSPRGQPVERSSRNYLSKLTELRKK